jgi:hypothetical protein
MPGTNGAIGQYLVSRYALETYSGDPLRASRLPAIRPLATWQHTVMMPVAAGTEQRVPGTLTYRPMTALRPALTYDDFVHIVTFGMAADGKNVAEVHCFVTKKCIISIHRGDCPALATVCDRIGSHHSSEVAAPQVAVFYLIMDTLIDSFFPVLSDFDDAIDDLEGAILKNRPRSSWGRFST